MYGDNLVEAFDRFLLDESNELQEIEVIKFEEKSFGETNGSSY